MPEVQGKDSRAIRNAQTVRRDVGMHGTALVSSKTKVTHFLFSK
jgi:hypothetical protein